MTEPLPDWIRDAAKARALAGIRNPQRDASIRRLRQAMAENAIQPGTVVIYSGSLTDHHGPAVFIGPSGNYPAGEETRYTLIFAGKPKLEGVGRASFRVADSDDQVPSDVRELAEAIAQLNDRQAPTRPPGLADLIQQLIHAITNPDTSASLIDDIHAEIQAKYGADLVPVAAAEAEQAIENFRWAVRRWDGHIRTVGSEGAARLLVRSANGEPSKRHWYTAVLQRDGADGEWVEVESDA